MLVMAILLLAGGSACGKQGDTGRPYSVDRVRRVFKQDTADELIVERSSRRNPVLSNITGGNPVFGGVTRLGVAPGLDAKYGDFDYGIRSTWRPDGGSSMEGNGQAATESSGSTTRSTRRTTCRLGQPVSTTETLA